jgi:hypothetical protein
MLRIRNRRNPRKLTLEDCAKESGTPVEALVAHQISQIYKGIQ